MFPSFHIPPGSLTRLHGSELDGHFELHRVAGSPSAKLCPRLNQLTYATTACAVEEDHPGHFTLAGVVLM
jgi:hypothetical protein